MTVEELICQLHRAHPRAQVIFRDALRCDNFVIADVWSGTGDSNKPDETSWCELRGKDKP